MEQTLTIPMPKERVVRPLTHAVPRPLLLLLTCGTAGSSLFMLTYLIEGATRPGYSAWQQAISALSLGPGGWVQQVNFIVFGAISICMAFVTHKLLKGGRGATWYPILRALDGLGLLVDGIFSQDPAGYPQGAASTAATLHGEIHLIFAFICITSMALSFVVLARRFAGDPYWRGWAASAVITGLLTIIFIAVFGSASAQHSEFAGVLERLATSFATVWGLFFLVRLWKGTPFMASNA